MSASTLEEVRAVQFARTAEQSQYLTFMLGGEMLAIGILAIREIIEYGRPTALPMMPRHMRGVINLRGAAVPVVDLSARFGRAATEASRRTCFVIVETAGGAGTQVVGVLVDAVNEVLEIPPAEIEPAPAFGTCMPGGFIAGMGKVRGGFVTILNLDHVLSAGEIDECAGAGAAAG